MSDKTSWIYNLKKPELEQECQKRNLKTKNQTVKDLRQTLAEAIRVNPDQTENTEPKLIQSDNASESESEYKDTMSQSDGDNDDKPKMSNCKNCEQSIERWNLQFDTNDDAVEFLESLEDLIESSGAEKEKVLKVIPRFLRGKAVLWYRNNKESFKTWGEFITFFKLTFLTRDHETELLRKIMMKKQHYRQKFTDYLIEIQTLMRRYGRMTKDEERKIIYENMSVKYKYYIKWSEFTTIHQLIQLARDYENLSTERHTNSEKGYNERLKYMPRTQNQYGNHQVTKAYDDTRNKSTSRDCAQSKEKAKYVYNYNSEKCCWSCGRPGHTSRDCRGKKLLFCSRCGRLGVQSIKCCKKTNHRLDSLIINMHNHQQRGDIRPFIKVTILQREYDAVVDTGSTRSYVNEEIYKQFIDENLKLSKVSETAILANGTKIEIKEALPLKICVGESKINHQMLYHPDIKRVLIGMDIMSRVGITLKWTPEQIETQEKTPEEIVINTNTETNPEPYERDPMVTEQKKQQVQKLVVKEYKKGDSSPKRNTWVKRKIRLIHKQPVKQRYYPRSPKLQGIINEPLMELNEGTPQNLLGSLEVDSSGPNAKSKRTRRGHRKGNRHAKTAPLGNRHYKGMEL